MEEYTIHTLKLCVEEVFAGAGVGRRLAALLRSVPGAEEAGGGHRITRIPGTPLLIPPGDRGWGPVTSGLIQSWSPHSTLTSTSVSAEAGLSDVTPGRVSAIV